MMHHYSVYESVPVVHVNVFLWNRKKVLDKYSYISFHCYKAQINLCVRDSRGGLWEEKKNEEWAPRVSRVNFGTSEVECNRVYYEAWSHALTDKISHVWIVHVVINDKYCVHVLWWLRHSYTSGNILIGSWWYVSSNSRMCEFNEIFFYSSDV